MSRAYERFGAGRVRSPEETAEARKRVRGFWHHSEPAPGTPAELYLARRGLPWLARHSYVRFRSDTTHPDGGKLPAMVVLIHDAAGDIASIHRTYLDWSG